jgi:hypothetical protein
MSFYQLFGIVTAIIVTAMFVYLVLNSIPKQPEKHK